MRSAAADGWLVGEDEGSEEGEEDGLEVGCNARAEGIEEGFSVCDGWVVGKEDGKDGCDVGSEAYLGKKDGSKEGSQFDVPVET